MKKVLFLLLPSLLFCEKIYETKLSVENRAAMENEKIKCRWVCDKKIYKEQKIAEAISFYKKSKYYKFDTKKF
ncbi:MULTISPECIES: hypothetical protein [Sulfurimonas]|uniref:hypothetical protein n=1 Tax=Sulfurimonas TaxID=202746 RepID=UPI00126532A1|nr:hypothetical protein [Sulfurimonas indica]